MDDTISVPPALTPEEWRVVLVRGDFAYFADTEGMSDHARAALYLYGRSNGFTDADVDMLREEHDAHALGCMSTLGDPPCKFLSLADRIQALLPPRETPQAPR